MNRFVPLGLVLIVLAGCAAAPVVDAPGEDPWLWLESVEGDRALDWVRDENARSLAALTGDPRFSELEAEAAAILNSTERIPYGRILGDHVYNFWQDTDNVRGVWRRAELAGYLAGTPSWQTLIDMDALDAAEAQNWIFEGYTCLSPDYERCMVNLSRGGTDAAVYREFSIPDRAFVDGGFALPQAKSSLAWADGDTLIVGTDWGDGRLTESGYAQTVKLWRRGQPLAESRAVYQGAAEDVGVFAAVFRDADSAYPMAIRAVTFFETEYYWRRPSGEVTLLPLPRRSNLQGMIDGHALVTLDEAWTYRGVAYAQGALVALDMQTMSVGLVYEPAEGEAIDDVRAGRSAVFIEVLDNVIGKVRRLDRTAAGDWQATTLPLPDNGVVGITSVNPAGNDLLVSFESLVVPDSLYYIDAQLGSRQVASLPLFYDTSDVVVEQRFATSADGTRVPYFLMGRSEVLARGNAPTIQYGYGGFQASILPNYYNDPSRPQHGALAGRLWVSRGGVMVLSNIRGGGEYGPAWHEAALKRNRHRAFEDFFAIAEALIADGVTTPARLGAVGRSNGGLLMGVALTQRPDLYAAIDCGVPLLDMLRYHRLLAGASWVGEYGSPEIPAERDYLAAYSPYQRLDPDADYPPVLFCTSTKDDRVHPGHARKMAARMAAQGHDFYYYENIEGGHGGTANQDQLAFRTALEYVFFVRELMDD